MRKTRHMRKARRKTMRKTRKGGVVLYPPTGLIQIQRAEAAAKAAEEAAVAAEKAEAEKAEKLMIKDDINRLGSRFNELKKEIQVINNNYSIRTDKKMMKGLEKTKEIRKLLGDNRELIDKYKRLGLKNSKINELIRNYRE